MMMTSLTSRSQKRRSLILEDRKRSMAEAPCLSMAGERLEKLAREITCRICSQHYHDARVLPCCHYYCLSCLQEMLRSLGTIKCPICQTAATGLGNPEQLPPALVVNHLKMIHSRIAKMEEEGGVQCEMCLDPKATAFCKECDEFICASCLASHQKMKAKFHGHKTYSLQDLKSGAKSFPIKQLPPCECPEHNEQNKLYCFDCCRLICRDCIVIDHAQHHYEFVTKSVETTRKVLTTNLTPLKQLLSSVTESAMFISDTKNEVTAQGVSIAKYIHERFTAMIELLKVRELELLKKTESIMKKKLSRLSTQDHELRSAMNSMITVLDYVSSHLEIISDEELLIIQHQLYSRIEDTMQAHKGLRTVPCDAPNLAVKIDLEGIMTEVCQENAKVYLFPLHSKSHIHLAEMDRQTVQFVMDSKAATRSFDSVVSAQLVSEVDGSAVDASVFKGGRGLYEVTYTPKMRGRHQLYITVDGATISDSPLPVSVTIPPKNLGPHPHYVVSGIKHPYAAIFDEEQNLLVTESNGTQVCLLMRNNQGTISNKHRPFVEMDSTNPSGIAADHDGNVYVTSASGHSITKYSSTGHCLATRDIHGNRLGELMHPCGLQVIDNEVYVCDRNNCRVHVFNRDLVPLRVFGVKGRSPGQLQWPYDVVQDNSGHLYVSDCDNHRIQVFDKNGTFLYTFGSRGTEKGQLRRPMGMAISNDGTHIFVSEYDNHRVSAYKTDGTFVSSFGHYGTGEGQLCYPVGLVFDSDGFLYVCDQGNNRIQVF